RHALEVLRARYGLATNSDVIRFALRTFAALPRHECKTAIAPPIRRHPVAKGGAQTCARTMIYLSDDDRHALAVLRARYGLATNSQAIRFALRTFAALPPQASVTATAPPPPVLSSLPDTAQQEERAILTEQLTASQEELRVMQEQLNQTQQE